MARISNASLLLVQTGELKNSIPALELKEYTSPKAVQPNEIENRRGVPGVMYPSEQSFNYNPDTGELKLKDADITGELIGYIGYVQDLPPGTDLEKLPVVIKPSQSGGELKGQYYEVIDPNYKYLTNDWGTGYYDPMSPDPSNIQRVHVGDRVIKQEDGDWIVVRNTIQNMYLLKTIDVYPPISDITITS